MFALQTWLFDFIDERASFLLALPQLNAVDNANYMKNNDISPLAESIATLLQNTTEENPVHWSVLTEKFVDTQEWTNEQLVSAMNKLLVPAGNIRGSTHNFWFEPLP